MTKVYCDLCGRDISDPNKRRKVCIDKRFDVCPQCYTKIWLAVDVVKEEISKKGADWR